jgi:hypothetical protein
MPWCEDCDRFYTPSTLTTEGDCPEGHHVADPDDAAHLVQSTAEPREEEPEPKVPWHFWLLLVSVVVYLGWRAWEGVVWLINR